MSRSQAAYDLAELVGAGVLQRIGNGRATRYRVRPDEPATQRRWTEERIRAELVQFCAGRQTWPSAREFKDAGRGDLYVAASRYGGVARWARALGLAQAPRTSPRPVVERRPARLRTKLAWAGSGALAVTVLAAAAAVALGLLHRPAAAPRAAAPSAGGRVADESLHASLVPDIATRAPAAHRRHAARPPTAHPRVASPSRSAPTIRSVSVASPSVAQPTSVSSLPAKSWLSSASSAPSAAPAPLAAPSATQAPAPIKAP